MARVMVPGRFDSATLSHRVREHLRDEILSNRLPPGTHLQEEVIAAQLGISRAPVREALRLLASEDLVTIAPRRGVIVKALSPQEFLAAYQVREALEVLAVRLAMPRLVDGDLRTLRDLHQEMVLRAARGEVDRFFEANAAFHTLVVERSGNERLRDIYRQLMNQMRRYRMRSMSLRGGLERSLAEHAAILETIERRDTAAAARLLAEHIEMPQRLLQAAPEGELVQVGGGRERSPARRLYGRLKKG
ncbi:MAG: GntR family transcriptional regulator [Armatimonadota bacterium]